MAEIVLQAFDLTFSYPGDARVLGALRLSVRKGQRLALLGANGAGKTTLLLHLNGTIRPHTGRIEVDGVPAEYDRRGLLAWRQQVGLVFQDPDDQLFAATVRQDVSFGPMNLGLAEAEVRRRVEEALDALEISDLAERPTHMLSHGQKKLVAIAGALAMRPNVMLFDEPTAGLDPRAAEQFFQTLARLHRRGTTLVLATHDMDTAYAWADEVALLDEGRVVRQGPPDLVLRERELLAKCRLRMPWALEMALGFQEWADIEEPPALPRTPAELLSYCRQLVRQTEGRRASTQEIAAPAKPAILLVAFGSTVPDTRRTFAAIDEDVRRAFPDQTVVWAFTSRRVRDRLREQGKAVADPQEALDGLKAQGHREVIVQSLHVMAGEEFQGLLALDGRGMELKVGAPLLGAAGDIAEVGEILAASCRKDRPNVITAHGNDKQPQLNEPLLKLAALIEARRSDVALATIDGPPGIAPFARIRDQAAGAEAVHFIPLMLISGVHIRDDVMGDGDMSWKRQLRVREASVAPPLGDLPDIRAILIRHIREARERSMAHP